MGRVGRVFWDEDSGTRVGQDVIGRTSCSLIERPFAFDTAYRRGQTWPVKSNPGVDRPRSWEYYDRRAAEGKRTIGHALQYWTGLGVAISPADVEQEAIQVRALIRSLPPTPFVDVGAGPGTFTPDLPGWGIALDQSEAALRVLRSGHADCAVARGDALRLPLRDRAVDRVFAAHIYGLLTEKERLTFLSEARRVAEELVVVDAGRRPVFRPSTGSTGPCAVRPSKCSDAISTPRRSLPNLTADPCSQGAST
jgi:SAM-dependent methyltransferase